MMKKCVLAAAVAVLSLTVRAEESSTPPQHININGLGGQGNQVIENVVVPIPSEIFAVLDKQHKQAWGTVVRPINGVVQPMANKEQDAIMMGIVIAEGFVAVEATNAEQVDNIGKSVLELAKPLGVSKAVVAHANAIRQAAQKGEWPRVRAELDTALKAVRNGMEDLHDNDLAQLVSMGGWLRGTEALTQVVTQNFSPEGAELLHQPLLLQYFQERIAAMSKGHQADPVVSTVKESLMKLEPIMAKSPVNEIDAAKVKEVEDVTGKAVQSITDKAKH